MSAYELDLGFQYKSIKNRSNSLSQVEAKAANQGNQYTDFGADLFNGLYQSSPTLKDGEPNLYTETLQAVQNSESFKKIKRQTQGNLNWSAIGASILLDELTSKVDYSEEPPPPNDEPQGGNPPPNEDKEEEEKDKGDSPTEDDNEGESEDNSEGEPNGDGEPNEDKGNEDEENSEGNGEPKEDNGEEESEEDGELDEYEDELEEEPEPKPVSQRIQDAVDKAGEKLGEMLAGLKEGTGIGLSSTDMPMVDGFTKLAENPNLVQILRRIGRLKLNNSFLSALQVGGPEETIGVTWGDHLDRLMPTEYAGLAGNDDEFMVWADKYNRSALQEKKYQNNTKPGKGPMIVCIDISSSMIGQPLQWAKTIAAAMYLLAVKEKRGYSAIFFNGRAMPLEPKDQKKLDPLFLERVVNVGASGGTNYEAAWTAATSFMDKVKRGPWSHADIVFITDGECSFNKDKWLQDKKKFGVRLFSFLLGVSDPGPRDPKVEVWTIDKLRESYDWLKNQTDKQVLDAWGDYIGQPIDRYGNQYANLIDTSDAVVYVPSFTDEAVANSFELVKNAKQRKGQMVA